MPKEFQGVIDSIGGIFDSPVVQLGLRAIAVYWVIFWLAAAYWAFRDLQLRTENPILPYLAAAFIIIFTPVLFPAAVVIYRVVRPQERIGETYERTLAEEALLAELETVRNCPVCRRRVHDDWIVCPTCRTRLNRVCPNCGKLVGLDWSICAWCGTDFAHGGAPAASGAPAVRRTGTSGEGPGLAPASAGPGATVASVRAPRPGATRAPAGRSAPDSLPER